MNEYKRPSLVTRYGKLQAKDINIVSQHFYSGIHLKGGVNMDEQKIPKMVTIKQAAEATNLSVYCIRQMYKNNKIVYIKSGQKVYINLGLLIKYLNGEQQN